MTSACDDNTQLVFMILVGVAVTSACDDNTQLKCHETYLRPLDDLHPSSKEFCKYCH